MELSRRNGATVEAALRSMDIQIREQQERIDQLSQGVSSLATRLAAVELSIAIQRATTIGSGPTVK